MDNTMKLALKVLEQANKHTKWNFQMTQCNGVYYVEAMITSRKEGRIFASFLFKDSYVLLKVWSPEGRYDDGFVYDKLTELSCTNAIPSEYSIYSTVFGKTGICFNSPMPLEVLEKETKSVIKSLMVNMINAMAETIF